MLDSESVPKLMEKRPGFPPQVLNMSHKPKPLQSLKNEEQKCWWY